jgi:uncharacterized protein YrzB (UPF0473 family)
MSEEFNEEQQIVEVLWEDGSVIKCEIYDVIDFEDKTYALLLPLEEEESEDEDAEMIVMQYVEDDEESAHFETIDDEDEFNRVCEYVQSLEDEYEDDEEE